MIFEQSQNYEVRELVDTYIPELKELSMLFSRKTINTVKVKQNLTGLWAGIPQVIDGIRKIEETGRKK